MNQTWKQLQTASDIDDDVLNDIETVYDGWFSESPRIDWQDFIDRLERCGQYDCGSSMDSEAIKQIKKHVRKIKAGE